VGRAEPLTSDRRLNHFARRDGGGNERRCDKPAFVSVVFGSLADKLGLMRSSDGQEPDTRLSVSALS